MPYPSIDEVVKNQALFEYQNVKGRMVGFHFPTYLNGLTYPGFHLHFANNSLTQGGHVLDFRAMNALIEISPIYYYYYHKLPDYSRAGSFSQCGTLNSSF